MKARQGKFSKNKQVIKPQNTLIPEERDHEHRVKGEKKLKLPWHIPLRAGSKIHLLNPQKLVAEH